METEEIKGREENAKVSTEGEGHRKGLDGADRDVDRLLRPSDHLLSVFAASSFRSTRP